jgi:hypothetical protein
LIAGQDQTGPERLRYEEDVARRRSALRPEGVRVDCSDDGQPVLRLLVPDRVPAGEQAPGRTHLLVGRREDRGQQLHGEGLRECRDGESKERRTAHREHIVEGVRGGDRAVVAGLVDHGREEVERENQRPLVVESIDRGVVGRSEADEQVVGLHRDETA